jgi:predicted protein tyrosine phosphatase
MVENLTQRQLNESAFIQINEPAHHGKELFGGASNPIQSECRNVLNLWFDDAEEDLPLLNGDKLILFDEMMAQKIVNFVQENRTARCWILHCTAGISRSGAVGEVLSEYFQIDYKDFKYHNPQTKPNCLVKNILRKKFFNEQEREV